MDGDKKDEMPTGPLTAALDPAGKAPPGRPDPAGARVPGPHGKSGAAGTMADGTSGTALP